MDPIESETPVLTSIGKGSTNAHEPMVVLENTLSEKDDEVKLVMVDFANSLGSVLDDNDR